jgi:poly-gamma-glutamate system protein
MKLNRKIISLSGLFIFGLISVLLVEITSNRTEPHPQRNKFTQSSMLAMKWFDIVNYEKDKRGLISPKWKSMKYGGLMGVEYSYLTTTLGSVEAKQTSVNPGFAALVFKWLSEAGLDSNSIIGVNISGSFPALAIAALAAIKVLGAQAILISSVGASSFGANDSLATWIDIEQWLFSADVGFDFYSTLITPGGINDNGGGLQPEGISQIKEAVERNGRELFFPKNLKEASVIREKHFIDSKVDAIVNVGGNHTALGNCNHSWQLQSEFITHENVCKDFDRSFLFGFVEKGIPVFHLLNIKQLAVKYGLPITPYKSFKKSDKIYLIDNSSNQKIFIALLILVISILTFIIKTKFYMKLD